jgi:hypothetical protein
MSQAFRPVKSPAAGRIVGFVRSGGETIAQ